jgi:hypothetical protein
MSAKKAVAGRKKLSAAAIRERNRRYKAAQRERAREAGLCIINPAHGPVEGATCRACQDAANEALAERRKARSALAKVVRRKSTAREKPAAAATAKKKSKTGAKRRAMKG